jgi:addiction module RelE/StbE family toxin
MSKNITLTTKFIKHYSLRIKPRKNLDKKSKDRIDLFKTNTKNPVLRDHQLKGNKESLRSFSVTGDLRIIYKEYTDHYTFLDIGTHSQVYK